MPDNATQTTAAVPAQLARQLSAAVHGPHDDTATAGAAALAAESIRYLIVFSLRIVTIAA